MTDRPPGEGRPREEASRRRTFAIISHPDAGKTTLTEKFPLYAGCLDVTGRDVERATWSLECDFDAGTWACFGEEGDEETVSAPRREVLALLREHPEGLRVRELVRELGKSQPAVSHLLRAMAEAGEVRKDGGIWKAGRVGGKSTS